MCIPYIGQMAELIRWWWWRHKPDTRNHRLGRNWIEPSGLRVRAFNPQTWTQGYKTFSCSTQLCMKLYSLINNKMPTIVGILTCMSGKNSILGLTESKKGRISWYFYTYKHLKFHAQLRVEHEKSFITSGPDIYWRSWPDGQNHLRERQKERERETERETERGGSTERNN